MLFRALRVGLVGISLVVADQRAFHRRPDIVRRRQVAVKQDRHIVDAPRLEQPKRHARQMPHLGRSELALMSAPGQQQPRGLG